QQTERGLLVTLGDVLFAFNKAELSAQAAPRLDKLANFLRQFPDRKLIIEGHTDSVGGDAYNQELSERRAQAVQNALVQRGVAPDRITARGYGKTYPVADNASPEGRAMNRRVEIVIADDKGNLRGR
ncbi:OmpA family protein, partial [Corallococcus coralloides]|nr:OmpA family protein [Corallococcus coralloides]